MSRHRIVRTMNYSDEYDEYDDVYGHSVDDESCISPTDAQQWMYDRNRGQQSIASFITNNHDIKEETDEETESMADELHKKLRRNSDNFKMPTLNEEEQVLLESCIDEIRNVVGDSVSERQLVETIMSHKFDCTKALDAILNNTASEAATTSTSSQRPIETGVGLRLLEKSQKQNQNPQFQAVKATLDVSKKGFEINSPRLQSPAASGRNTPVGLFDDGNKSAQKTKEQLGQEAKDLFEKERGNEKPHIHLVVIGHVDAGKSTLLGRFLFLGSTCLSILLEMTLQCKSLLFFIQGHTLYDLGYVSQKAMHKHEQESKKVGKQSFMYAWVLDETSEERSRGITMDVGVLVFETESKAVTLLDAPGHKDFIPNMISGATQADVALLVVDATKGEFETGFEQGGQTREHAILVRSLGVSQLGVVVNKMDTVNWSKERFDEIVNKLKMFLRQAGFKESDVTYIPCSGMTGENLVKPPTEPQLLSWYNGPTLISVIDKFRVPERPVDKALRVSVTDIFKGISGQCVTGRIETGVLRRNDTVLVCPIKEQATVKQINIDETNSIKTAFAGDQVTITLSGIDASNITVGSVICSTKDVVPIATRFQARLIVFNIKMPITNGYPVVLHLNSLVEAAVITKLKSQLHKVTGEIIKKNPRCLSNNSCALVEIEVSRPICIEKYAKFKELGRVALRVGGVTIACGLVTKILK